MGQTVVFKVSLDADEVVIDEFAPRPPRPPHHRLRDAALGAVRDRHWQVAALACLVVPAVAAVVTFVVADGAWVGAALLVAAAIVTPVSGAWSGGKVLAGERAERAATWVVTGASGGALALASLPGIGVLMAREGWGEEQAVPTLTVLALTGAAGAWLGLALANRSRSWSRTAAAAAAVAFVLVPLGASAALVPATEVTERIVYHSFVATYAGGHPAFICRDEKVVATRRHTEDVTWIAMASPLAWVVDAAAFTPESLANAPAGSLAQAQAWTRSTRVGPDDFVGYCYQATSLGPPSAVKAERYEKAGPIGARLATGAAALCAAFALVALIRRRST